MRRAVWGPLLVVVGLLGGASLWARRDQVDLAAARAMLADAGAGVAMAARRVAEVATPILAQAVAAARQQPIPWVVGVLGVVLCGLVIVAVRRRRHAGAASAATATPDTPAFETVLESALVPGGSDGRRHRVLTLARDGRSIGEIARSTRLSQDAIRTVLDAR